MSEDGKEPKQVIEVKAVVENKEELEKLRKEKEESDKAKTELEKQLEDLKKSKETSDESKADLEAKLAEISRQDFEKEKTALVKTATDSGLPEEKVKYIQDAIKTPEDLKTVSGIVTEFTEAFKKIKSETPPSDSEPKPKEGETPPPSGRASLTPPPQGDITSFTTAKAMVDDLYDRATKGDKEADKQLKKLWQMWGVGEKKELTRLSISECLQCHAGIPTDATECPFCGWKKSKGME